MKIGFVLDDTLDKPDGVQQYVVALGNWLSSRGHEVHYLVGETNRQDLKRVHSLGRVLNLRFNANRVGTPLPANKKRVSKVLTENSFDILHVQIPYSPMLAGRVIKQKKSTTALVGTFHILPYSMLERFGSRLLGLMQKKQLALFDYIYSVSAPAGAFAYKTFGVSTQVMPNVVDVSRFANAKPKPIYKNKVTIVFLGRLVERKGCMQLLKAIRFLRQNNPELNFQVVVAGKGPELHKLMAFTDKNKLSGYVDFVGFVSEDEKARLLKSADITVFPSLGGESFGIVLLEAMASRTSVVLAGNNLGYASVMEGARKQLFNPRDTSGLAGLLAKYIESKQARTESLSWQKRHIKAFDINNVGDKILSDYRKILKTKRSVQ